VNIQQIRKEIVYNVMKDLQGTPLFIKFELKVIRTALNKNITKVLSEVKNEKDK
jgi:hypothetical protein